jgi:hypothetical protein
MPMGMGMRGMGMGAEGRAVAELLVAVDRTTDGKLLWKRPAERSPLPSARPMG